MLNLNCVICAELFTPSDDVHVTTCGHMFHFVCLKQWMERSKSCPQCRNKCTDRNIIRVYFNLANLDVSRIDVGSLQEQLDNADLQIKLKEKEIHKFEDQVKELKSTQKMCMKTIKGLEDKIRKNDFIILSYQEQLKILKTNAKVTEDLRKEVKSLNEQIETMESISSILTATSSDAEKLLKTESDPRRLSTWVATLKRELRISEGKKTDLRNMLRKVQNDLHRETALKKAHEDRISHLESENYQLQEKVKNFESAAKEAKTPSSSFFSDKNLPNDLITAVLHDKRRSTISPTIKENIKKIEESNSPYLNIKSSSVGLMPFCKRPQDFKPNANSTATTTTKLATLKISPSKNRLSSQEGGGTTSMSGVLRKCTSDITEKYSIFKKPRLQMTDLMPSSKRNALVPNGFGGSERVDPFARLSDDEIEVVEDGGANRKKSPISTVPKASATNLTSRLKAGGLRNFKLTK